MSCNFKASLHIVKDVVVVKYGHEVFSSIHPSHHPSKVKAAGASFTPLPHPPVPATLSGFTYWGVLSKGYYSRPKIVAANFRNIISMQSMRSQIRE
jgi:hypothetical protein